MKTKFFIIPLLFILLLSIINADVLHIGTTEDDQNVIGKDGTGNIREDLQYFRFNRSVYINGVSLLINNMIDNGALYNMSISLVNSYTDGYTYSSTSRNKPDLNNTVRNYLFFNPVLIQANRDYGIYVQSNTSGVNSYYYISWSSNTYSGGGLTDRNGGSWTNRNSTFDLNMDIFYTELEGAGIQPELNLQTSLINGSSIDYTPLLFSINGTSINNSNNYECFLYINNVLSNSFGNLNLSILNNVSFDLPLNVQNWYNLNVSCENENATNSLIYLYYFDTKDIYTNMLLVSLNTTLKEQTNKSNEGINMLWFTILLIIVGLIPYIFNDKTKEDIEKRRTILYICIIVLAFLFYVNQVMNFFNLLPEMIKMISVLIFALISIHIFTLFETV